MDESNNIKRKKVINFLTHISTKCDINERCFYIIFEINDFKIISAKTQLVFVFRQIIIVTDKSLEKINFLIINTCFIMRSF